jgi:hypothetical protein
MAEHLDHLIQQLEAEERTTAEELERATAPVPSAEQRRQSRHVMRLRQRLTSLRALQARE